MEEACADLSCSWSSPARDTLDVVAMRSAAGGAITLAVVDGDRMMLDGLKSWLWIAAPDLRLVAGVGTVDELLAGPGRLAAVVLLDMGPCDNSDPVANVRRLVAADRRVLVVSAFGVRDYVVGAFRAGAKGYLTKDNDLATLASAARKVAAGGTFLSARLVLSLARDTRGDRPALSRQERAILTSYASGMTLECAARKLGISLGTAKKYLDRVKLKYAAVDRPAYTKLELAARVREDGITPDAHWRSSRPNEGRA